ncbi:hypothetical protein J2847_001373 [Azospirillum agricola]|uniref:hypothetical protein n=1 Tax=Azospirillum agricola TaxID=1720247 RepID=UPI001AE3D54A|nr:hypothetical protein [Azospirillum agricola]MBP2228091.1 hypothetical protein [Azospirillum agricola]
MMRKKLETRGVAARISLHFANRNATKADDAERRLHFANRREAGRGLEQACASLQDAAEELETVLARLRRPDERADLHEAIGAIMETMQLITATHARLVPAAAAE